MMHIKEPKEKHFLDDWSPDEDEYDDVPRILMPDEDWETRSLGYK